MKRVYEARDGLEAHMVAGLIEQAGIMAQVNGDMLQGGVGDLPAAGLASVWVADGDEQRARAVVGEREQSMLLRFATVTTVTLLAKRLCNVVLMALPHDLRAQCTQATN